MNRSPDVTNDKPTAPPLRDELTRYLGEVDLRLRVLQQAQREFAVLLAPNFSLFDFIKPDENVLSDLIALLLDPRGVHGQGAAFLESFLRLVRAQCPRLPPTVPHLSPVRVMREQRTSAIANSKRRIDITVTFSGFGIGIENKPWADEGNDQLLDYSAHLAGEFGDNFILVFMPGSTRQPTSLPPIVQSRLQQNGQLAIISYNDQMTLWLQECARLSEAEYVRWFLRDFQNYIQSEFRLQENGGSSGHAKFFRMGRDR